MSEIKLNSLENHNSNIKSNIDNLNYESSFPIINENSSLVIGNNSNNIFIRAIKYNFLKCSNIYNNKKFFYLYTFKLILCVLIIVYFYKLSKKVQYIIK
jgi:hypothetical protein